VLQSLEVIEATYHRWRNQYGGMKSEEGRGFLRCCRFSSAFIEYGWSVLAVAEPESPAALSSSQSAVAPPRVAVAVWQSTRSTDRAECDLSAHPP